MALFVSHVDESAQGGIIFAVGALTAKPEAWIAFSDDWQANVLDPKPTIPFFKYNNVHQLLKESQTKKIEAGIKVINRHVARADALVVDVGEYLNHFENLMGVTYDSPTHASYVHIIQACALGLPDKAGQVDFIFDDMDDTQYLELLEAFRRFKQICPDADVRRRLNREPIRGDDEQLLPLQAADLWTGMFRAACFRDVEASELLKRVTVENRGLLWDAAHFVRLLSRTVQRFPEFTSGKYYEDRKARSKRLKSERKLLKAKKIDPTSSEEE